MRKELIVTALSIMLTLAAIVAYQMSHSYYPAIRVANFEGTTLTFVSPPLNVEKGCTDKNQRFLDALKQNCPQCTDAKASCPEHPQPGWLDALRGQPTSFFSVYTEKQVTLIDGPPQTAQALCQSFLAALRNQGLSTAACISPAGQ